MCRCIHAVPSRTQSIRTRVTLLIRIIRFDVTACPSFSETRLAKSREISFCTASRVSRSSDGLLREQVNNAMSLKKAKPKYYKDRGEGEGLTRAIPPVKCAVTGRTVV